jgi:glycosyltransferase involved in cell wall biosynthesis
VARLVDRLVDRERGMKILLLSKYPRRGVSSRQRFYQYLPWLAARGHAVAVLPLFDDAHLERTFGGARVRPLRVAGSYLGRLARLLEASRADLVWLEGELWPFLPAVGERILGASGIPFVVDYDDAVFHKYDRHRSSFVRRVLASKIETVMAKASMVIAGNEYIADRARAAGAPRIEVIPTVVDVERYPVRPRADDAFRVGWIGSPQTVQYLAPLSTPLAELRARGAEVELVGVRDSPLGGGVRYTPWSEDTEAAALSRFDVGVMPLPDTPWERGKCGYKLIQTMAAGRATIASPVGVNRELVVPGETGFLADGVDAWRDALARLERDRELTRRMGAAGRAAVEARFSLALWAPRIADLLEGVSAQPSVGGAGLPSTTTSSGG